MPSPQPVDPPASDGLTLKHIPKSRDRSAVDRFASTFDGYKHFGEDWQDDLKRLREQWDVGHALPWDVDELRAWLALEVRSERFVELDDVYTVTDSKGRVVHEPDPAWVTPARARHDLKKAAIVDRIRALQVCRERNLRAPTAGAPPGTLIPRTPMLERYLTMKRSQRLRLAIANADEADATRLAQDFVESVQRFSHYANIDEAFHSRTPGPDPCPKPTPHLLWETDDVTGRVCAAGVIRLRAEVIRPGGKRVDSDLSFKYVDREIIAARTKAARPTHAMQGVELIRHDLLLRAGDGGLPVIGEVKTPTDQDAFYALIQLLAAASQLITPNQRQRLRTQQPNAGFTDPAHDSRVDLALVIVDPDHCGRLVPPTKTVQPYRPSLDEIAPRIAELLVGPGGIGEYIRRIFRVNVGLGPGEQLQGTVPWAVESITATQSPGPSAASAPS